MLRIGLVGKNKNCNVWVGEYLRYHYRWEHKRLNEPIEHFVKRTHWYLEGKKGKVYSWEQKLTIYDYLYKLEPEIWVKYMEWRLTKQLKHCVVSDIRYVNELQYLRDKLGFKIIRVQGPARKLDQVQKSLGTEFAPGTLALAERYSKDFTTTVKSDFTVSVDMSKGARGPARAAMDIIVEQLLSENVDKG